MSNNNETVALEGANSHQLKKKKIFLLADDIGEAQGGNILGNEKLDFQVESQRWQEN